MFQKQVKMVMGLCENIVVTTIEFLMIQTNKQTNEREWRRGRRSIDRIFDN